MFIDHHLCRKLCTPCHEFLHRLQCGSLVHKFSLAEIHFHSFRAIFYQKLGPACFQLRIHHFYSLASLLMMMFLLLKKKWKYSRKEIGSWWFWPYRCISVLMSNGGRVGPENPQNQVFWLEKFNKYCIDDRWGRVRPKTLWIKDFGSRTLAKQTWLWVFGPGNPRGKSNQTFSETIILHFFLILNHSVFRDQWYFTPKKDILNIRKSDN